MKRPGTRDPGPEEASIHSVSCCSDATTTRPYGELGSVDITHSCGCCHAVSSDLTAVSGAEGGNAGISPGWGCDEMACNVRRRSWFVARPRGKGGRTLHAQTTSHSPTCTLACAGDLHGVEVSDADTRRPGADSACRAGYGQTDGAYSPLASTRLPTRALWLRLQQAHGMPLCGPH